jgi:hypothetical protein
MAVFCQAHLFFTAILIQQRIERNISRELSLVFRTGKYGK